MNALNTTINSQHTPSADIDPIALFPKGCVITVVGPVKDWTLEWAGRIRCSLGLPIGDLKLRANRDTLPLDIQDGTWVQARLMRSRSDESEMHVLSAVATSPAPGQTAWVPVSLCPRSAGMRELRSLLSTLEPALQGLFMSVMADTQVQRNFFWRPAAADHHCYPGGLFDQSIAAAKVAHQGQYADERERGLVTIASLLFDIGKVFDARLQHDRTRSWPELRPHAMSVQRLEKPLTRIASQQPELAAELRELLANDPIGTGPDAVRMAGLRMQIQAAIQKSWGPTMSLLEVAQPGDQA